MEIKDIMEILFNIFYLIAVWFVVIKMSRRMESTNAKDNNLRKLFIAAFALLSLGDTGHVGFRVLAYLKGGLLENAALLGYGKLATSITVTIFYALFVEIWRVRFNKKQGAFTISLYILSLIRIIIMLFPENQWGRAVAPFNWEMYRNIPLMIVGLAVAIIFLKDGIKEKDDIFKWTGIMILISFGFYIPVILFARIVPTIGFLMIPKTLAYLAAAFIAYNGLFKGSKIS